MLEAITRLEDEIKRMRELVRHLERTGLPRRAEFRAKEVASLQTILDLLVNEYYDYDYNGGV